MASIDSWMIIHPLPWRRNYSGRRTNAFIRSPAVTAGLVRYRRVAIAFHYRNSGRFESERRRSPAFTPGRQVLGRQVLGVRVQIGGLRCWVLFWEIGQGLKRWVVLAGVADGGPGVRADGGPGVRVDGVAGIIWCRSLQAECPGRLRGRGYYDRIERNKRNRIGISLVFFLNLVLSFLHCKRYWLQWQS